uniref:Pectate lyase n=1 Tax=Ananas comosus var. bracteatus TaxID=296719 RepID=A0A6V7Q8L6_ANACO|nr:unnamed protein product [Ananas comosus var. bracteatus]
MESLQNCEPDRRGLFFFFAVFLAFAAVSYASVEDDEYWRKRAEVAEARARAAYNPDPESVADSFNRAVHRVLEANSTRRSLRGYAGKCLATNPIDRCWRCRKNWIAIARGWPPASRASATTPPVARMAGFFYVVTDPSDNELINPRPGTLRYAVIRSEPLWIVFARDMTIRLSEELIVNSNKTIDGRGARVAIANGAQITIQNVHNIIIHNIRIKNIKAASGATIRDSPEHFGQRMQSDGDGISVLGSSNIWIDHVSMSNCADGIIDVIDGSTAVTISNSHFAHQNNVMLFGATDSAQKDTIMQITVAFNHFGRHLVQRMPRCRWGFAHVVNNDYTYWEMYAIGGSQNPTIISQGNRYKADPNNRAAGEVTKREYTPEEVWRHWTWRSEGDVMQNGAYFIESGPPSKRSFLRSDFLKAKSGKSVGRLTRFSGVLKCQIGKRC